MAGGFPYKLPFTLGFVAEPEPEAGGCVAGGFPYKLPFTLGFVAEPEPEATAWELALSRGGWRRDPGNSGWMQPGTGQWRQHGDASGFV